MKRTRFAWLLAGLCLTILVPAASACINDSDLVPSEREFKSRYEQPQPPQPEPSPGYRPLVWGLSGGGVALLAGALTVTVWRRRRSDGD
jgi:hypothetical protein